MRRRFLATALAAAFAGGRVAFAADRVKRVGYLSGGATPDELVQAMVHEGLVLERDYKLEVRTPPDWNPSTLDVAAAELVSLHPDALVAWQGTRIRALARATKTIPIVCGGMADPVGAGYAQSLRRPGGNVTGLSYGVPEIARFVFGLLKALRPELKRVVSVDPPGTPWEEQGKALVLAAREVGVEWVALEAAGELAIERALALHEGQALIPGAYRDTSTVLKMIATATRLRIAVWGFAEDGGLFDYGMEHENRYARVAAILAKVLRGVPPGEIPFELPDHPYFHFNRTTARKIGVTLPPDIALRVTRFVD